MMHERAAENHLERQVVFPNFCRRKPREEYMPPLEGLRGVDLTRVLSGPFCTMQLGDLGAEVIKVERPGEGDDTRAFAPPYQGDEAAYFLSVNRNKKSITLDMKSKAGREVLWRLIEK